MSMLPMFISFVVLCVFLHVLCCARQLQALRKEHEAGTGVNWCPEYL